MRFISIIEKGDGNTNPGHMVVGSIHSSSLYVGFRCDLADLPHDHRSGDRLKEYLLNHAVPGHIRDETRYIDYLLAQSPHNYHQKEWQCSDNNALPLPPVDKWRNHACYSFNPDCFHTDLKSCYNCVTWATMMLNQVVQNALEPVKQGRVWRMIQQFLGPFAFQVGKLCDFMASDAFTEEQRRQAYNAMKAVLGENLTETLILRRPRSSSRYLMDAISQQYSNTPDKFAGFLQAVQSFEIGLPDDNPLKTYKS